MDTSDARAGGSPQPIVRTLLDKRPCFHTDGPALVSWHIQEDVLRWLSDHVGPGVRSIETGTGYSTVVFASGGGEHLAISPAADEHARIASYCREEGIDVSQVEFAAEVSQSVLPRRVGDGPLDLVLIDGDHAFPAPFIDWFYVADRVVKGGLVLVDDTQLRTGAVLRDFLRRDVDRWRERAVLGKTHVFEKLVDGPVSTSHWMQQPWVFQWHAAPRGEGVRAWWDYFGATARIRTRLRERRVAPSQR